jgi:cytochrome c biogenesis protein CcmG/thiol:disulfide interchange protein DsbE
LKSKFLLPLIAFVILVGIFVVGLTKDPSRIPSPLVNNPAPVYSLPSLQDPNVQVGSADYADQMVLVNIWATWCPGCRHATIDPTLCNGYRFSATRT